jgi:hypothetical protein
MENVSFGASLNRLEKFVTCPKLNAMTARLHLSLAWFLLCSFTCNPAQPQLVTSSNLPTRDELMTAFRESRKILIAYGSMNPQVVNDYAELAKKMKVRSRFATIEVKPCSAVTAEDWQTKAIVLIGTSVSNSVLYKIVNSIPIQLKKDAFIFDEKSYSDSATVAVLSFYPNPLYPKLPLTVLSATNDGAVKAFLESKIEEGWRWFGFSAWNYEVYKNGKRLIMGMFHPENWSLDKKVHFDFSDAETLVTKTRYSHIFAPAKIAQSPMIQVQIQYTTQIAERIRQFLDSTKNISPIEYHFYTSAENKGLITGNTTVSHADFTKKETHTVLNELYHNRNLGKENELLLRQFLGKPSKIALERGLATYFTENWQRKGYNYWTLRLFTSGNIISPAELLDNDNLQQESHLLTTCLSASLVEFLLQKEGKAAFLNNYQNWSPSISEMQQLDKEWHDWLSQKAKSFNPEKRVKKDLPYLKGFNFAHEGYGIFNGYVSNMATQSLAKQANELYCNATAIVPYTFMENPNKPSFLPIANSSGDEHDEGVVHSAFQAQQLGMTVVLKPQIWIGRGAWPGDVAMTGEADWQQFFQYYYKWIRHYALLAEMYDMDALCIGTEFAKATVAREQDWRALIQKIRGLYHGKLTYAANWGAEFEQLPFWDQLDFIGLNCYYPLSTNKLATKEELRAGFLEVLEEAEQVQKRFDKPLVFTEIGFKSVQTPWLAPHEASNDMPYFGEHQQLCYEVVLENIQNKKWIQGILWWKFPSYLDYQGLENDDFTPNRKPAEAIVKKWFAKMP